jgi:regulator of protease activity HflC (stomatin/prohibitin superfamily)
MAHDIFHHDHDHDHDHGHGDEGLFPSTGDGEIDAANKSLSDALHWSFRLLSVVMVLAVVGWLMLTGMTQIQPSQRGVRLVFGAIQGQGGDRVLGEGARWSWPGPIGQIVKVSTASKELHITDFWMHETAEDLNKPLSQRTPPQGGLDPALDGALLTGDLALLHIKLDCLYKTGVRGAQSDSQAVIDSITNVAVVIEHRPGKEPAIVPMETEMVRNAVCAAAIRVAAERTLESITKDQTQFASTVQRMAQQRLDQVHSGIQIHSINVPPEPTVPLAVRAAFQEVQIAGQASEKAKADALAESTRLLNSAAGETGSKKLVGNPDRPDGLLSRYAKAREDGDQKAAGELLAEIDQVLLSEQVSGEAAKVLSEARAYSTAIRQRAKSRADLFNQLIGTYEKNPDLVLARLWADTHQEVMTNPKVQKFYLAPGQKAMLRITGDPKAKNRALLESLKAGEK